MRLRIVNLVGESYAEVDLIASVIAEVALVCDKVWIEDSGDQYRLPDGNAETDAKVKPPEILF